ncbi:MAG TPA: hypothetical protein VK588_02770 [Chitinophagaceae bacterium]|nr:hypothetical protein [Chitinophagaceae bacterium]
MKKIFTLALGILLTTAMFAADKRPMVTVTSAKRYEIVIDGTQYNTSGNTLSISSLYNGSHDVKVFQAKSRGFMKSKKLVASSSFQLRNSNVQINIDRFGQIQITESRPSHDWNDKGYGKSSDRDHGRTNHDKRF